MRHYFAYAINMDMPRMSLRCPTARLVGQALLPGHSFLINREGFATVVRRAGAQVYGAVWRIARSDELALDDFEGLAHREYRKAHLRVRLAGGGWLGCMAYEANVAVPGRPVRGYLDAVVAAARALRLPDHYVDELRSWGRFGGIRGTGRRDL